ncbi:hypothetical protein [Autumnicola psychrophila]|uniref:Adhesin domain-containing protein n=1 Tax=Autumnicola psychrophila TaxID=3075592 RepID=A0ABU3DQM2_9FLAO|nr:hypothetical protein [Zunongwangia sp. F225]MDT0685392.1 hypothetical protein [Zunongwangia sp. F225]
MRTFSFGIFLLFGVLLSNAQKDTREIFNSSDINEIEINADEVYKIILCTSKTGKIKISAHSEGEYFNDISLISEVEKDKLKLHTRYPEVLTGGYDKLSAHKVISMEIHMEVPENMTIFIRSNLASVVAKGNYNSFYADLREGYCNLLDFIGNATVNTYKGNIYVEAMSGNVKAESRNGVVHIQKEIYGSNLLKLTSINGDISVLKTK